MTSPSLSQQFLYAAKLTLQPSLLSRWTLRITYISALFAFLQAISEVTSAPPAFVWCNLCICLWCFNILCQETQHSIFREKPSDKEETSPGNFLARAFPIIWATLFFVLFGCFVLLDWIPYLGTGLSILLTPLFFLLATVPPLGILVQLALPIFVLPYLRDGTGKILLLLSSFQFLQQPSRAIGYFFLAYAPLAFTLLLLLGSWGTVFMMDRFSTIWPVALLQKSLLIILSGVCLGPSTLFLTLMGVLPSLGDITSRKRHGTGHNRDRQRAQWFMHGEGE